MSHSGSVATFAYDLRHTIQQTSSSSGSLDIGIRELNIDFEWPPCCCFAYIIAKREVSYVFIEFRDRNIYVPIPCASFLVKEGKLAKIPNRYQNTVPSAILCCPFHVFVQGCQNYDLTRYKVWCVTNWQYVSLSILCLGYLTTSSQQQRNYNVGWQNACELERMWKEVDVVYFEVLSQHSVGSTEKNHESLNKDRWHKCLEPIPGCFE
jgi:hypothetical protein